MDLICKNCGNTFQGKYCNQCGQKVIAGRLSLGEFFHKFIHSFTHVDKGLLLLAKELFIRPGIVAREYIEGKRAKYFNPLQYLILLVAVSTFLTLNYDLLGPKNLQGMLNSADPQVRFSAGMSNFFYKYFNLVLFATVPVVAFFSWLMFRKSGFNFAENLVFVSFISAQRTLFFILISPILYFTKNYWYISIGLYYLFWIVYFTYAYIQFYQQGKLLTVIKYIGVFLLSFLIIQSVAMGFVYLFMLK